MKCCSVFRGGVRCSLHLLGLCPLQSGSQDRGGGSELLQSGQGSVYRRDQVSSTQNAPMNRQLDHEWWDNSRRQVIGSLWQVSCASSSPFQPSHDKGLRRRLGDPGALREASCLWGKRRADWTEGESVFPLIVFFFFTPVYLHIRMLQMGTVPKYTNHTTLSASCSPFLGDI